MNDSQIIAVQVQRRDTIDGRAQHSTLRGWKTLAYCKASDAAAETARQRERFGAHADTLQFRTRIKNPGHSRVPPETVQLGHAHDLSTQFRDERTLWDFEVRDWLMLTVPNAMDMGPGEAPLFLVRERTTNPTTFSLGHSALRAMRRAVQKQEPVAAERMRALAAIGRLEDSTATLDDLEMLATYADFAGLDWSDLFPEWKRSRNPSAVTQAVTEEGAETYDRWHEREPHDERARVIELPDLIGVYVGRAMRIGYRSDKWHARGKTLDYDHDFTEGMHIAPECWADTPDLAHARALVIIGGDMCVTEDGID